MKQKKENNMQEVTRTFEDKPATRERVPLLVGLVGPSGSGKTFSALRLATGIQRVCGGDIFVVDTESRRSLHYADQFRFRHVAFGAPFSPLDYLAALEHCASKGAGVVVIDSMSHEHEGPGGVLEMHEAEVQRLSRGNADKANKVKMLAWSQPKAARRRMINSVLQLPCNFIFCWRAKPKLKVKPGKEPEELGYMAIAGEEFLYEMTVNCLLHPKSGGVPTWTSEYPGERETLKMPRQFFQIFQQSKPLDEDVGQQMAEWAAGDSADDSVDEMIERYETCADVDTLAALEDERRKLWGSLGAAKKKGLKRASDEAQKRVEKATPEDEERAALAEGA